MRVSKFLLLTAALVASPAFCQQSGAALQDELSSRYAAMKLAMANKDEKAIRALLADGFVSVDVSGTSEDATKVVGEVLALPADPNRQSKTTILSAKTDGQTAQVEQRYEMTTTKAGPDGGERSIALSTLSSDKWVKDYGVWRIARTVTEQLDYSVDGVAVVHKENPTAK